MMLIARFYLFRYVCSLLSSRLFSTIYSGPNDTLTRLAGTNRGESPDNSFGLRELCSFSVTREPRGINPIYYCDSSIALVAGGDNKDGPGYDLSILKTRDDGQNPSFSFAHIVHVISENCPFQEKWGREKMAIETRLGLSVAAINRKLQKRVKLPFSGPAQSFFVSRPFSDW
jgi:hypothetical protein